MEVSQNKTAEDEVDITKLQRPKPIDVAHSTRRLLWFLGLYCGELMQRRPFQKIMRLTVLLTLMTLPVLMVGKLFSDDWQKLLECWGILWALVFQLIKLLIYSWSKSITDLEYVLQSEIFNIYTGAQGRFVTRAVKHLEIYENATRVVGLSLSIFFVIFVIVDPESLPLPLWTPIDFNPIFWQIYEDVVFILSVFAYIGVDSMILGLIANAAAQFQILNDNLKNSCERNLGEYYPEQEIKIQFRFGRCIRHHTAILEYFNKMQGSLSTMLFCQIFFSALGICFSGFEFHLVPTRSLAFACCVFYSVAYLIQILSWCMVAEDITIQSSEIATSCYMADWYACNSKTKQILLMIMQRATEPITLKAGPFFTMSLRTFVMILRNAYSCYAILHNVYKQ